MPSARSVSSASQLAASRGDGRRVTSGGRQRGLVSPVRGYGNIAPTEGGWAPGAKRDAAAKNCGASASLKRYTRAQPVALARMITSRRHVEEAGHPRNLRRRGYMREGYAGNAPTPTARRRLSAFARACLGLAVIDISLEDEQEGGFEAVPAVRALCRRSCRSLSHRARQRADCGCRDWRLGAAEFLTKDLSRPHLIRAGECAVRRVDALRKPKTRASIVRRGDTHASMRGDARPKCDGL